MGEMMDVIRAIEMRQSVGRMKPDPVPKGMIERILESAVHAPNHRLTEPWRFHVFTGKGRGELARARAETARLRAEEEGDRKSTRLNSSHANISYAVFCLKQKKCRSYLANQATTFSGCPTTTPPQDAR